jgi:uncharacterized membrane protein HdeD (DUF308 family)
MAMSINSAIRVGISFVLIALGYFFITSPSVFLNNFFTLVNVAAIAIGGVTIFRTVKDRATIGHPIMMVIAGGVSVALGIILLVLKPDFQFIAFVMAAFAVILAFQQYIAFERIKGKKGALYPLLFAVVYWIFGMFLAKDAGYRDYTTTISTSGYFLVTVGLIQIITIFMLKDHGRKSSK